MDAVLEESEKGRAMAQAAIKEAVSADTKETVEAFVNAVPRGANKSYSQLVKDNQKSGGKMTGGVTWGPGEIHTSVPPHDPQTASESPPPQAGPVQGTEGAASQ